MAEQDAKEITKEELFELAQRAALLADRAIALAVCKDEESRTENAELLADAYTEVANFACLYRLIDASKFIDADKMRFVPRPTC